MPHDLLTSTFAKLRNRLLATAASITRNDDDAADALQEAFCRLWQRDFDNASQIEGTVSVTVRNLSVDAVRRRIRVPQVSLDEQPHIDEELDETETETATIDCYRRVTGIIEHELTPQQREVLTMRDVQGCAFSDIAAELGIQEGAVRTLLSRARKKVRDCYRKQQNIES